MVTKNKLKKSKPEHNALNGKIQNFSQSLSGKSENGQIFLSKIKNFFSNIKIKKKGSH